MHKYYLQVSIHHPINFKIVIVIPKRINQTLGHFKPSNIEKKLQRSEKWKVAIELVAA